MSEKQINKKRLNTTNLVDVAFNEMQSIDVVGLEKSDSGRSCTLHLCCGQYIRTNDKLVCQWCVQSLNGNVPESVVQVWSLNNDGLPGCHVGYLPKRYFKKFGCERFHLMYLRVKLDYRGSENQCERSRSNHNGGMALCEIIRNNPNYNGRDPFNGDPCDVSVLEDDNKITPRGQPAVGQPSKKRARTRKKIVQNVNTSDHPLI